ncbi:uncharacterized protein LOC118420128 [Branchiostoma floridae]|uniref:Uncharacterized protein LOC118420128 n=1 Tax=Branchiostoma floridae TaxID=7739 RepID=A0A9J7LJ55_BRAFL|nr:uncharacterized protein LOC118420128 [Branchiostoma floridae]
MAKVPDKPRGDDDDDMSSLLARVSKKLGWDKFSSLEDALQEVEAKTPDWKGGKKRNFFGSQDDKENRLPDKNTLSNVPSDRVRSHSDGSILQEGSRKKGISKTTSSTNDHHGDKTCVPKPKDSHKSLHLSTSGTNAQSASREMPLSNKPTLSNSPHSSLSQKEHFVTNNVSSEREEPVKVPAVKPKLSSVKQRSAAGKENSQGCGGSSDRHRENRKVATLGLHGPDNSSGTEEDSTSSKYRAACLNAGVIVLNRVLFLCRDRSRTSPVLVSSDSDDFESFVQKLKTPTSSRPSKPSAAHPSVDDFIVGDSEDDSDGDDDVFGPRPIHVISSSSDEDEFQKGIIARYRSPKPTSGLRRPKKPDSSRKGSHRVLSSSSSDDDQPRIPSWRDDTPLRKNNTPLRKNNTPLRKEDTPLRTNNTPSRKEDTPLRKQVLQKAFLTPQVPPGYSKPALPVPKLSTAANPRSKSASETSLSAAPRRNSEPADFLSSLSTPARGKAPSSPYVSDFRRNREELVKKLYQLYNETVFDNKVAFVYLLLFTCCCLERVRDTLIHELCHAATWVLNGVKDGHGRYWQFWARKANQTHPSLPAITRCHTYAINTKFTYQCTECGYKLGRHSKSLDLDRQVCGYCRGRFQLVNKDGTPARTRAPSKFALFVKERYGSLKRENAGVPHKEVMRLLSAEFATKNRISSS